MTKDVIIYTDGACFGNPGAGGYGAVLIQGSKRKEISEGYRLTTNNRMEVLAVIRALELIKTPMQSIKLHTDSKLIVDTMTKGWLQKWQRNGWRKADKSTVLNKDLWEQLSIQNSKFKIEFIWVKGHAGNEENERCDIISKSAAENPELIDEVYEKINGAPSNLFEPIKSVDKAVWLGQSGQSFFIKKGKDKIVITRDDLIELKSEIDKYL